MTPYLGQEGRKAEEQERARRVWIPTRWPKCCFCLISRARKRSIGRWLRGGLVPGLPTNKPSREGEAGEVIRRRVRGTREPSKKRNLSWMRSSGNSARPACLCLLARRGGCERERGGDSASSKPDEARVALRRGLPTARRLTARKIRDWGGSRRCWENRSRNGGRKDGKMGRNERRSVWGEERRGVWM